MRLKPPQKEEEIHGKFGIALYEILRDEHSELFTPEFLKICKPWQIKRLKQNVAS